MFAVCFQPMEVFVDDETKLTLHGLQQYYCKLKDSEKNRKLFDLLDVLEFNQVSLALNPHLCFLSHLQMKDTGRPDRVYSDFIVVCLCMIFQICAFVRLSQPLIFPLEYS